LINTLYLLTIIVGITAQNITKKAYNKKVSGGAYSFSAGSVLFAILFFLIPALGDFKLSSSTIIYSVSFAVCYSISIVFNFLAIATGPLSITSLAVSYSLIIPTFYGLWVLGEERKSTLYIGIFLLLISLLLINIESKGEKKKITFKWAVFTLLAFIGNGFCSTVQKIQVENQKGNYKNEFMVIALIISFFVIFLISLFSEKKNVVSNFKKGFWFYSICGLANGIVNLLVILLSNGMMSASVMFPLISAGGIIATFFISLFVYKEKLSIYQISGLILGICSIIFLNL